MTEVQYEEDLERAAEGGGSQCVREKGRGRESTAAVVHANKVIMSILKPEDADGSLLYLIDSHAGEAGELNIQYTKPQHLTLRLFGR